MLNTIFSKFYTSDKLTVIAGPCSAESELQVINTAKELAKNDRISIFRAGLWKPRTRPGSFAGVGDKGLEWLRKVKEETRLQVCTEVAKPSHVESCLKAGIDMVWIGARTTTNPFAVQEIADALKSTNISVLIKNPISPDSSLWLGAVERLDKAGIKNLGIIHRGFSVLDSGEFRNQPIWRIVLEIKNYFPNLPIFCDPSHIAGRADLVYKASKQALKYNISGLMIESHISPEQALTDIGQQLKPKELKLILEKLFNSNNDSLHIKDLFLYETRDMIDTLDYAIMNLLKTRFKLISKLGDYKAQNNIPIIQADRWKALLQDRLKLGENMNLSKELLIKIFTAIHDASVDIQSKGLNRNVKRGKHIIK